MDGDRMDTMGTADELGPDEEPPAPRRSLVSTEALAIGSLALGVCSFFAGTTFQLIFFVLGNRLQSQRSQYIFLTSPMAVLSGLAVALGLAAIRRARGDRWAAGLAGGGVIVGGVGVLATLIGLVLALTLDEPTEPVF
jgi:hypothetical protein